MSMRFRFQEVSFWCKPCYDRGEESNQEESDEDEKSDETESDEDGKDDDQSSEDNEDDHRSEGNGDDDSSLRDVLKPKKTLSGFLRFLRRSPHIANEIRKLAIDMQPVRGPHDLDWEEMTCELDDVTFTSVLRSLPQLKILILDDVSVWNNHSGVLKDVKLDHLTIRYWNWHSWGDQVIGERRLWDMLSFFGSVSSLLLEWFDLEGMASPSTCSPLPVGVTSLTLREVWTIPVLLRSMRLASAAGDPRQASLRTLDIQDIDPTDILELNSLLEETGTQYVSLGCAVPMNITAYSGTRFKWACV
ncbi:hypothetical protein EIP86_004155 [Pleurotus ostreatoroseus]|nr:hypothetical protein EIP86_004155 [Pleurotus ostreatoroseus]